MYKKLLLVFFLIFPFQGTLAEVATDLADGLSVEQAVQNAIDAGETPEAIAAALQAAGISTDATVAALVGAGLSASSIAAAMQSIGVSAEATANALVNAGILFDEAVSATATAYGVDPAGLAAALTPAGGTPGTGPGAGSAGVGGGGGGGGGGTSVSPS